MNPRCSRSCLPFLIILIGTRLLLTTAEFLRVDGKNFYYGETKVFLSGVNIAWYSYAFDFGNKKYETSRPFFAKWIQEISQASGNTLRVWIHIEGQNTPEFDPNGFPTAPDRDGTLISDLSDFLDLAANNNVFVVPVLWNGAVGIKDKFKGLIIDDKKLEAYINKVLVPMVRALKSKPALGAWEIMNEPEGSVQVAPDSIPCFDTMRFKNHGADWTKSSIPMSRLLKFVNKLSAAIKRTDRKALVTLGSWSHHSQTDAYPEDDTFNHYKDECLIKAGGEATGILDFYQMHTYAWKGSWSPNAPFKVTGDAYKLDKPVVIGEFSSNCSMNEGVDALWDYGYKNGYAGLWSWMYNAMGSCADAPMDQIQGMERVRSYTSNGQIAVKIRVLDSEMNNRGFRLTGRVALHLNGRFFIPFLLIINVNFFELF